MRLEKMNEENRKYFMNKFSYEELESISTLLFDLNKEVGMPQIDNLIKDMINTCKGFKKERDIDIKYTLKKFEYGELLSVKDLLDIYPDDKKYEEEKYYVDTNIRNYQLLAKQTQDFENLGFDLAVYYWESLSPQVKNWYRDICDNKNFTPADLYVYCKKINDEQYGRK